MLIRSIIWCIFLYIVDSRTAFIVEVIVFFYQFIDSKYVWAFMFSHEAYQLQCIHMLFHLTTDTVMEKYSFLLLVSCKHDYMEHMYMQEKKI